MRRRLSARGWGSASRLPRTRMAWSAARRPAAREAAIRSATPSASSDVVANATLLAPGPSQGARLVRGTEVVGQHHPAGSWIRRPEPEDVRQCRAPEAVDALVVVADHSHV